MDYWSIIFEIWFFCLKKEIINLKKLCIKYRYVIVCIICVLLFIFFLEIFLKIFIFEGIILYVDKIIFIFLIINIFLVLIINSFEFNDYLILIWNVFYLFF